MRGWALVLVPVALATMAAGLPLAPRGLIFAGMPPERFQYDSSARIVFTGDLNRYCGEPAPDHHFAGCERANTIYMPNPCPEAETDHYAKILCHEMAHVNGWSAVHEY